MCVYAYVYVCIYMCIYMYGELYSLVVVAVQYYQLHGPDGWGVCLVVSCFIGVVR